MNIVELMKKDSVSKMGEDEDRRTPEEEEYLSLFLDRIISADLEKYFHIPNMTLIFQENVIVLCQVGAGFSPAEADDLRRAIGKKKIDLMNSYKDKFVLNYNDIHGWKQNYPEKGKSLGDYIWDKIVGFAKYGFNKSHAVAYTLVSLKTAELQKDYFTDYMKFNYDTMDAKHKTMVIDTILNQEGGAINFPGIKNFTDGCFVGELELNPLSEKFTNEELLEVEPYKKLNPYELFLSDINPKVKTELLLRGVFDEISTDIMGLANLKSGLGVKSTKGCLLPLDNVKNIKDFLTTLRMADWLDFEVIDELAGIYKISTRKDRNMTDPAKYMILCKNVYDASSEHRRKRVGYIIKSFGIYKDMELSAYPDMLDNKYERAQEKINEAIPRIIEMYGTTSNQLIEQRINKGKLIQVISQCERESMDNVYTVYVADKAVKKDGTCKLTLRFNSQVEKVYWYVKDRNIILNVQKNDIIDIKLKKSHYLGRNDHLFKGYTNIELVRG